VREASTGRQINNGTTRTTGVFQTAQEEKDHYAQLSPLAHHVIGLLSKAKNEASAESQSGNSQDSNMGGLIC
jgi:hypothetical protein